MTSVLKTHLFRNLRFILLIICILALLTKLFIEAQTYFFTTHNFSTNVRTLITSVSTQAPSWSSPIALVTASNYVYREFLYNFMCNLERLNLSYKPLVFALDHRAHNFCHHYSLPVVLVGNAIGAESSVRPGTFSRKGPQSFNDITKSKLVAMHIALNANVHALMSDADIYWCDDAINRLTNLINSNINYSSADVLIMAEAEYRSLNSGFYFVRANARTKALFSQLVDNISIGAHDQDVVNSVFCDAAHGAKKIYQSYGSVPWRCIARDGADIRLLPTEQYPSGAQFFHGIPVFSLSRKTLVEMCTRKEIVVVHNNFIRATKKKSRFIQKGMWLTKTLPGEKLRCRHHPVPEHHKARRICGINC